ncbi:MAG: hypothetical protein ABSA53_23440 [Streptosporangiaceae bacterium]|jgi:hypothetical protein
MTLFRRKPPVLRPGPPRAHRPWHVPETEIPAIVPVQTLLFDPSDLAAVAIIGIAAYTTGFEFSVARRIRPGTPGLDQDPAPMTLGRDLNGPPSFQLSLRLADGRTVADGRSPGDAEPTGPVLLPRGGGGTSHSQLLRWWAWPLPPSGPLEFSCQWPMYGISETRVGIDAQLILDAARHSISLWPRDGA